MTVAVAFSEPSVIGVRAFGPVTYQQIHMAIDRILRSDPHPGDVIFVDSRGVTDTPSIADLAAAARDIAGVVSRGVTRLAIVSDSEAVHAVARTFASFASVVGANAKGFLRDETAARRWLKAEGPRSERSSRE